MQHDAPSQPQPAAGGPDSIRGGGGPRFADFDSRGYRTVDVRMGYRAWVPSYRQTVEDAMDVALLEAVAEVPWEAVHRAVDLGCGTGRTGTWLRGRGVEFIDGVDITPEMMAVARSTSVYHRLLEADVTASGLEDGTYDAAVTCLVDEHLPDVQPLYTEAWRIVRPGGYLVLVGYHPHFIMVSGMPTHYHDASGEPVAIETYVHRVSEHISAGLRAGWSLLEMKERVIDDEWLTLKPQWERFRGHPISMALVWHKPVR